MKFLLGYSVKTIIQWDNKNLVRVESHRGFSQVERLSKCSAGRSKPPPPPSPSSIPLVVKALGNKVFEHSFRKYSFHRKYYQYSDILFSNKRLKTALNKGVLKTIFVSFLQVAVLDSPPLVLQSFSEETTSISFCYTHHEVREQETVSCSTFFITSFTETNKTCVNMSFP